MAQTIASVIESTKDESGLVAAQAKYSQYFIKLDKYFGNFQAECDSILELDGYADCIVKE